MTQIDWRQGTWRTDGGGSPDARIMITADWAPLGAHEKLIPSQPEAVYGDLLPKAGPNMRYDAASLVGLTAAPFHVATLANNHVFDYGPEGFAATLGMLREAGIETVGAGQSEVEIAETAHTVVVVEAPGMGDEVQAIKAGILEIADVFAVNKADREGADRTASALEMMLDPVGLIYRLEDRGLFLRKKPEEKDEDEGEKAADEKK